MTDPQSQRPPRPNDRPRRVGVYERLGRSTGLSPAIAWSIAVVILAIIIVLIIVFVR
jgi:hypothetical protein